MAPMPILFDIGPLLITTLGLFELNLVYSPTRNHFHLASLGNNKEEISKCDSVNILINY